MALTLDATLAAAQNNQARRPLVEIISSQAVADIPFDGSFFTTETQDEYSPAIIAHSTGRLILAYASDGGIEFAYSDSGRTEFTRTSIAVTGTMAGISICELTDGNIGMVYLINDTSSHLYRLMRRIVTVTGTAVSHAEIANWSHNTFTSHPWVATLGANSYLMVYAKASGSDYYLYSRASSDFVTWGSETQLAISGLTSTWRLDNPSLLLISTGDLYLWFDVLESPGPSGEELTNIYYSASFNSGSTWGTAVKRTAATAYGDVALHPTAVQRQAGQMTMIYTRQMSALHMNRDTTGWPDGYLYDDNICGLTWDAVNRKLYILNCYTGGGYKALQSILRIDVDAWEIDDTWTTATTPSFPSWIGDGTHHTNIYHNTGLGHYVAFGSHDPNCVFLLNGESDTITAYYFETVSALSVTRNMNYSLPSGSTTYLNHTFIDSNDRLWVTFGNSNGAYSRIIIGYIEIADAGPDYDFTVVVDESYSAFVGTYPSGDYCRIHFAVGFGGVLTDGCFAVYPDDDYLILSARSTLGGACKGGLSIWSYSTGAAYKAYTYESHSQFPYYGIGEFMYAAGHVYGRIEYTASYGQTDFRGMVDIRLSDDAIAYRRPSYANVDTYTLMRACFGETENEIIWPHAGYGIAVYDITADVWTLHSSTTFPGLSPDAGESWYFAVYDTANNMIFAGDLSSSSTWQGVAAFSTYGYLKQAHYMIGTWGGSAWTWTAAAELVQGYSDYDAVATPEPVAAGMYAFWINENDAGDLSLKWAKDGSSQDLSGYLVVGTDIVTTHAIDGSPAGLSFTVSHGHLFDPYNPSSLLSACLRKGRRLTLRWGEKISGTDYWTAAGTFYVTTGQVSFQRGAYPTMQIEAEDRRAIWRHTHIVATDSYTTSMPDEIIADLLDSAADMETSDIDLPTFDAEQALVQQWIDVSLLEIIDQICDRFGYYFRFDVAGKASARKITNAGTVSHIYTDSTMLISFSPDDSYSDFTNRVTVQGQELDFTSVTYDEERISSLAGTVGWWGFHKDFDVWFSDDKSRRCVNPRLEVIETATSIAFRLAGNISELLIECPAKADYRYCTIEIEAPNLTPLLATSIAAIGLTWYLGDICTIPGAVTVTLGSLIERIALVTALMVLGSTGNYQYEIWAQPLGSVRRSIQASWDDTAHQTAIGAVVEQRIEDPLCYSASDCQTVADFEGMVAQMQRRRVKIKKTAHLQDEDGDTIRLAHPYSGQNIDVFITNLTRAMRVPEPGGDGDGGFFDEIEGWVVSA